jgi:hypothetical protein
MAWTPARARELAESCLGDIGDRWLHVQAVGRSAEQLQQRGYDVSDAVIMSGWLHDVGYADMVAKTGLHPLDGAEWLHQQGAPQGVVGLVAYHSAAQFEAEARGLADELACFLAPDPDQLDVLTLIDMSTSPTGERVTVNERLAEILERYPEEHPVHQAVIRSRGYLAESANRAAKRLGLADVRTGTVL